MFRFPPILFFWPPIPSHHLPPNSPPLAFIYRVCTYSIQWPIIQSVGARHGRHSSIFDNSSIFNFKTPNRNSSYYNFRLLTSSPSSSAATTSYPATAAAAAANNVNLCICFCLRCSPSLQSIHRAPPQSFFSIYRPPPPRVCVVMMILGQPTKSSRFWFRFYYGSTSAVLVV